MTQPTELSDGARREIEAALAAGRRIEAIRLYREATGAGLAAAKSAVEAMQGELEPAPAPVRPSSGCAVLAALAAAALGLATVLSAAV